MHKRKTQARSLDTRRRLLDATLDTIVEVGLPRASTPKINRRAGVSNGAQQHHYPARSDLLVAALEDATDRFTDRLDRHIGELAVGGDVLIQLLQLIASTAPEYERYRLCWVEAMVAARTDAELADAMRPLDRAKTDRFRSIAARLTAADENVVADLVELTVYLVRGMAVQRGVHSGDSAADLDRLFDLWCTMVEAALARESR
jgi:AcrR family transcriptional regulator